MEGRLQDLNPELTPSCQWISASAQARLGGLRQLEAHETVVSIDIFRETTLCSPTSSIKASLMATKSSYTSDIGEDNGEYKKVSAII
jgi:hypothetical protein